MGLDWFEFQGRLARYSFRVPHPEPQQYAPILKSPNLDYRRLADQLIDRGMIASDAMQHVLQECNANGYLMPEVLVSEGLVSDLEISRVCTELFHLPFIPLDSYAPSDEASKGLDKDYLRQYGLVPMDRFGKLLTISMPGIVPTSILDGLSADETMCILPVVGTVDGNRRWLKKNLASDESVAMEAFTAAISDEEASWGDLFDAGDESVQLGLQEPGEEAELEGLDLEMPSLDLSGMDIEAEASDEQEQAIEDDEVEDDDMFNLDILDDLDEAI